MKRWYFETGAASAVGRVSSVANETSLARNGMIATEVLDNCNDAHLPSGSTLTRGRVVL